MIYCAPCHKKGKNVQMKFIQHSGPDEGQKGGYGPLVNEVRCPKCSYHVYYPIYDPSKKKKEE